MKNKNIKKYSLICAFLLSAICSTSCGTSYQEDTTYLHVYNWEDYIYQYDEDNETYKDPDMIEQFEEFINQPENMKSYGLSKKVKVIYDTFDTPETMYNELKLNKTTYDLMAPSDYMIQKLALNLDGLESTRIQKIDFSRVPNYSKYASKFLINNLKCIIINIK